MIAVTARELTEQLIKKSLARKRVKPRGVQPANRVGIEYLTKLRQITGEMNEDIKERLIPLLKKTENEYTLDSIYTRDQWLGQLLNAFEFLKMKWTGEQVEGVAKEIASWFVRSADRVHHQRTAKDFGIDILNTTPEIQEYLQASVYDNTRLIVSIPEQYLTNVESIVMGNVRSGGRWEAIRDQLVQEFGVTDRRARLIARDQTAKINGQLTAKRQVAAGFNYFRWDSSHDARVRDSHKALDRKVTEFGRGVYKWSDPPLGQKGAPIICGYEFQCRCVAIPVSDDEVKDFQGAKKSWGERV